VKEATRGGRQHSLGKKNEGQDAKAEGAPHRQVTHKSKLP
jgi:hypothetical protein